jgi:hypothetical protein
MGQSIDLDKIEKKAWSSYFQDGLFDIFFAILFITNGIQQIYYNIWFSLIMFIAVGIFVAGKQYITRPRLGEVRFGLKRMEKQQRARLVLLATFLSTLAIFLLATSGQPKPEIDLSIVIIILFIVIFATLAYFMDFPRFLLYGIMFASGEFTINNYGDSFGAIIFFIYAAILLVIGIIYLNLFLKKNPLPALEAENG